MKNERFKNINKVSDIVDLMIKGLKKEWVHVDMTSFGGVCGDMCYGCAATNALCELMQEPFSKKYIAEERHTQFNFGVSRVEIMYFEQAIDYLRRGYINLFICDINKVSNMTGIHISPKDEVIMMSYLKKGIFSSIRKRQLPVLGTINFKNDLIHYEKFRDWLRKKGL